jgi:MYXO-CTERM domain-containing protein
MKTITGLAITAAALASWPRTAEACGGTFCDSAGNPMAMPVDQTGENIFFVVADGEVQAHIQIEYDPNTDAAQFAWIVPVLATPTFEVGSAQLLLNLANGTVPSYGWVGQMEPDCFGEDGFDGGFDSCDATGAGEAGGGDSSGGGGDGGTTGGGTEVVLQDTVGAFSAVVLQSATSDDLLTWLTDNGYYADPNAAPILQQYIDEGAQFVAFKLTQGADVGEIHPVVIRYAGDEPCIPIRLTAIAAQDDMDIRAYFLGDTRVVPTNYKHVEINPVKLDWVGLGANYKEVVTMAVDSPMADGHAFVTEYSGDAGIVPRAGIFDVAWDANAFAAIDPTVVVSTLQAQGLMGDCAADTCEFVHPLVRGLLLGWLPPPMGVAEGEFWGDLAGHAGEIDLMVWNAAEFSAAVQERIVDPGANAIALLDAHTVVTRLYTTLSPYEMTEDPLFHTNAEVPSVDNTARVATFYASCDGATEMQGIGITPPVVTQSISSWPDIAPDMMPWALRIEEVPVTGAPIVLVDNTTLIEMLVTMWNQMASPLPPQTACEDTGVTASGSASASGGGSEGSSSSSGSAGGTGGDGTDGRGCGCTTDGDPRALGLLALTLLGIRRRSRNAGFSRETPP